MPSRRTIRSSCSAPATTSRPSTRARSRSAGHHSEHTRPGRRHDRPRRAWRADRRVCARRAMNARPRPYPRADRGRARTGADTCRPKPGSRTGVTSTVEAGIRLPKEMHAYQRLRSTRIVAGAHLPDDDDRRDARAHGRARRLRTGFGDEWLRIGPAKLFSTARSAAGPRACASRSRARRRTLASGWSRRR